MLFAFFFAFSYEVSFTQYFDAVQFHDNVLKRESGSFWMVLFVGMDHPECWKAQKEFERAAEIARDIANFTVVNVSEELIVQRRLRMEYVPTFTVYFPGGSDSSISSMTVDGFLEVIQRKMLSDIRNFDKEWMRSDIPSIVLFTEETKPPIWWIQTAAAFKDYYVRFGICSEFHIHAKMGISALPTILMLNGSLNMKFQGSRKELVPTIKQFLNGTLEQEEEQDFYPISSFQRQCMNRYYCVIINNESLSDEIIRLRQQTKKDPIRFLYGKTSLMKHPYYLWNPKKKGIIECSTFDELSGSIERAMDGGAVWMTNQNVPL